MAARRRQRVSRPARGEAVLIYGATGYTGGLVAHAARERDLPIVIAGRDGEALATLAGELGRPYRVARLDDAAALARALDGVSVALNAAGPFADTAALFVEACLRAGVHYLDVSGEVDALEKVALHDRAAREAGVMLLPGAGFDVVPSDCLAVQLARRLPGARWLRIAIAGLELVSRGSARAILAQTGRDVWVRRGGELASVPAGALERSFDFGGGPRPCTAVSWGDVVTAFHSTGIPNVEVYFEATPAVRAFQAWSRWGALFPAMGAVPRLWAETWAELQRGPPAEQRQGRRATIVAEVEDATGRRLARRLRCPEAYGFTGTCAAAALRRVLMGELLPGFQTPATVFGPAFLESLPEVEVEVEVEIEA
jgi:short subunit dehydrogenase-like uncharacterized protein